MYIITEKDSDILISFSEEIIANEDSTFTDVTNDIIYFNAEYIYYNLEDVPRYVSTYEYTYTPEKGFKRHMTAQDILDQRIAMKQAANLNINELNSLFQDVNTLKETVSPTYDTSIMTLEEQKVYLIAESKKKLAEFLVSNPIISMAHGEKAGVYSVTSEKQTLMTMQYATYQVEKLLNPEIAKITWNETGAECEEWTEEEFLRLILETKQYVYPMVSYQQSIETQIMDCQTKDDLSNIIIDYSCFIR